MKKRKLPSGVKGTVADPTLRKIYGPNLTMTLAEVAKLRAIFARKDLDPKVRAFFEDVFRKYERTFDELQRRTQESTRLLLGVSDARNAAERLLVGLEALDRGQEYNEKGGLHDDCGC